MCDSWENLALEYAFEVWELTANEQFKCIRSYEEGPTKVSIVLAYFPNDILDDCIVLTQTDAIFPLVSHAMPEEVAELFYAKLEEDEETRGGDVFEAYYNDYNWSYSAPGRFGEYVYGTMTNGQVF